MSMHAFASHPGPANADATPAVPTRAASRAHDAHASIHADGRVIRDFLRVPVTAPIQRKPSVSAPGDTQEREADAAADRVMRMVTPAGPTAAAPTIQRRCSACEDERALVQAKRAGNADAAAFDTDAAVQAAQRGGAPLGAELRSWFEPRFGQDFSRVRVHADADAANAARGVQARAYTLGADIVFGAGEYAPASRGGRQLIAHELAHVVQQGGNRTGATTQALQRQEKPEPAAGAVTPLVQKFIKGQATQAEKDTLRGKLARGELSAADVEALTQHFADEFGSAIANQLRAQGALPATAAAPKAVGQVQVDTGKDAGDIHTYYKARLRLHLSGTLKTFAGGLEGSTETTIEVNGSKDAKGVTVTIAPPAGDTALVAMIRAKAFPNGPITLKFGEGALKAFNMITLQGNLDFTVTGDQNSKAGGLTIVSGDLPEGVELLVSLSQSGVQPQTAPATGASVLPPKRLFAAAGLSGSPPGAALRLGFDAPLATDSKNPIVYGGLGLRAGVDTQPAFSLGGAAFVGAHLSPITVQMALQAGVIRGPVQGDPNGTSRTAPYWGVEIGASYQLLKHVEIMALASLIGSKKDEPGASAIQAGVGYTF